MYVTHPYTQRPIIFGGRAHLLFVGGGRAFDDRFYCPLTLQLFVEPVLIEDGHHYEKHAIQKHFNMLGSFSPLTKQRVNPNIAILDLDLKSIIEDEISKDHINEEEQADVLSYYESKKEIEKSEKLPNEERKTLVDHLIALPIEPQNRRVGTNAQPLRFGTNVQPLRFGTNVQHRNPPVVEDSSDHSDSSDSENTMSDDDQETWNAPPGTPWTRRQRF
mgnify:CR=1 FL=1|tara:strand:- start:472 stop:1125 length:654 start_codon:yes stop_codon:yes gene_type:complete